MRDSNKDVWTFLPDARAGRDYPCGGDRYRHESCLMMDKRQVIKSTPFGNTLQGFGWLMERFEGLGVARKQILVGLEATLRYGENLL